LITERRAASSPCQYRKPLPFAHGVRVFYRISSRAFNVSRKWCPVSATRSVGASGLGVFETEDLA
jgi:hypothetical protein